MKQPRKRQRRPNKKAIAVVNAAAAEETILKMDDESASTSKLPGAQGSGRGYTQKVQRNTAGGLARIANNFQPMNYQRESRGATPKGFN